MLASKQRRRSLGEHLSIAETMREAVRGASLEAKVKRLTSVCTKQAKRIELLEARHKDVVHFAQLEMALRRRQGCDDGKDTPLAGERGGC